MTDLPLEQANRLAGPTEGSMLHANEEDRILVTATDARESLNSTIDRKQGNPSPMLTTAVASRIQSPLGFAETPTVQKTIFDTSKARIRK